MNIKPIWRFITLLILLIIAFITLTYFVVFGHLLALDQLLISKIKPIETDFLTIIMNLFSFIGSTKTVIFISFILLLVIYKLYKKWQEIFLFLIVLIGSTAINQLAKFLIKRERPVSEFIIETGFSYPSGHTMGAMSLYGIITFLLWRHVRTFSGRTILILFSIVMIMIIAFSRIYLRVHYPSGIMGSLLLSGIWLYVIIWIFQHLMESRSSEK